MIDVTAQVNRIGPVHLFDELMLQFLQQQYVCVWRRVLCTLLAWTLFAAPASAATLSGSDDFNDDDKDNAKWGTDIETKAGKIRERNQRLEYYTSGSVSTNDTAIRPWILNYGSYTQSWEAQIDVSVPVNFLVKVGQEAAFGLMVSSSTVPGTNHFSLALNHWKEESAVPCTYFTRVVTRGNLTQSYAIDNTALQASLKIAFDAKTKSFFAYIDGDGPANGYNWWLMTIVEINSLQHPWGLTDKSTFQIAPFATSKMVSLSPTNLVYGDNFKVTTVPELTASRLPGKLKLSWPTNITGFVLEAYDPTVSDFWFALSNPPPAVSGGKFTVTNSTPGQMRYFRLRK